MHDLFYPQVGNFTLALLGSFNLALTWRTIDHALPAREACKWMVGVLRIAADHDCEASLIDDLEPLIAAGDIPTLHQLQARYLPSQPGHDVPVTQHALADYDRLLSSRETMTVAEVHHG